MDKLYGQLDSDFVWSQSVLNCVEVAINLLALSLLSARRFREASVTALVVCAMTCSKTVLYHTMELSCGLCPLLQPLVPSQPTRTRLPPGPAHPSGRRLLKRGSVAPLTCPAGNTGHNDWPTLIFLYLIPNGIWIWVPLAACFQLGSALAHDKDDK